MKIFLQEHLSEKLRSELENTSVRSARASLCLILIYQLAALPYLFSSPYYLSTTAGLLLSYIFRLNLKKFRNLSNQEWLRVHLLTIFTHSILWSLSLFIASQSSTGNQELHILTYLVFAGLIAAAAYSLSISKPDFYAFVVPLIGTLMAALLLNESSWHFKMASALIVTIFFIFLSTQRRRLEKEWLEQRSQNFELQSIIDAVPGGISVLKGDVYYRVNEYIRSFVPKGTTIIGHQIGSRWNDNPAFAEKIKNFISSREKRMQYEAPLTARGETRTYLITAIKSFNDETIISTIDIEDMKQIEREMLKQKSRLEHSSKMASLGEMAAGLAHEINNPVAIISGRAQQLMMALERDNCPPETLMKGLENIEQTSQRITRIVRSLRSFSHENEQEAFQNHNIKNIIDDTLTFCEEKFRNNGIEILCNVPADISADCRPTQMTQVLLNALNNSYDAIVSNNKEKWIRIRVTTREQQVDIRITDSGKEIPHAIRDKVMQPFFSTKEVGKGTGLGLSISKGIIDAHKGLFYFNYENTENTELVIVLPIRQPS